MFSDADRAIYSFEWGGVTRHVDPLLTLRNLDLLAGGSLDDLLKKVSSPEYGIAAPATTRLGYCVVTAFELGQPFNPEKGTGVTYDRWVPVLNAFVEWLEVKKKAGESSPTSAESTAPGCAPPPGFVSDTSIGSRSI